MCYSLHDSECSLILSSQTLSAELGPLYLGEEAEEAEEAEEEEAHQI